MTAQISDELAHARTELSIAAIENEWPFSPEDHAFTPVATSTACHRGYHCGYAVRDGALQLERLTIGLGGLGRLKPPRWRGLTPAHDDRYDRSSWVYPGWTCPSRTPAASSSAATS